MSIMADVYIVIAFPDCVDVSQKSLKCGQEFDFILSYILKDDRRSVYFKIIGMRETMI